MSFEKFTPRMVTEGIGRIAKNAAVVATDPVNMADLMNGTFDWSTTDGWSDLGATVGGATMTHGFAETEIKVDQSDGGFKGRVTDNTYRIATQLAEVGNLDTFEEGWLAADATTVVVATLERIKGLAAVRQVPHKSLAVATVDEAQILRVYYFRDVALQAGDSALALTEGGVQVLPVTWRAKSSPTAAVGREFGFIIEDNGFGGVQNPA